MFSNRENVWIAGSLDRHGGSALSDSKIWLKPCYLALLLSILVVWYCYGPHFGIVRVCLGLLGFVTYFFEPIWGSNPTNGSKIRRWGLEAIFENLK